MAAAVIMTCQAGQVNFILIVIYTWPGAAFAGATDEQLIENKNSYKIAEQEPWDQPKDGQDFSRLYK